MHGTLCVYIGASLIDCYGREISDAGRFAGNTTAGSRRPTLGMSTLSDDTAASTRLLY